MNQIPFDILQLLLFTIPGFFIVWSFRKASSSESISDFEYLMFSVFWGVVLLGFLGFSVTKETLNSALSNPYTACIVFSTLGIFFGSISGIMFKDRELFVIIFFRIVKILKRKFLENFKYHIKLILITYLW